MWIHLPSTCCPSAPATADSTSPSSWLCRTLARSCTWRAKSLPAKSWSRACARVGWMTRRSGLICEPSTATLGVGAWIASLRASPARTSPRPARGRGSRRARAADSSSTSCASFARYDLDTSSWKTCQRSLFEDSTSFSGRWPKQGTMRSGCVSRRRKWAPPTAASGSSCWPTPQTAETDSVEPRPSREATNRKTEYLGRTVQQWIGWTPESATWPTPDANVFQDGMECTLEEWEERRRRLKDSAKTPNGNGCGTPLSMAANLWSTAKCSEDSQTHRSKERSDELLLTGQAQQWMTPSATDHKGSTAPGQRRGQLSEQTECPTGLPDPATATGGAESSPSAPASRRRLNPLFVEWLQGLPANWTSLASTDSEAWETWSCRSRALLRLLCS